MARNRLRLCLSLLISSIAGVGAAAEPVVVFDDTRVGTLSGPFAELIADRLGISSEAVLEAVPATSFAFDSAILWPGNAQAQICPPDQPEWVLSDVLDAAAAALDAVDFDLAIDHLEAADAHLACASPPVAAVTLARVYYLLGYARFVSGDSEGAFAAFAQAAAVDPGITWDNGLPPEPRQTFNNAVLETIRLQNVAVSAGQEFALDGLEIDGRDATEGTLLQPGRHHMRVPAAEGGLTPIAVDVAPGAPLELVPTAGIVQRWFGSPADAREAVAALAAPLEVRGKDELYVLDPVGERIILVHPQARQVLEVTAVASPRLRAGRSGQPNPGVVLAIAGGVAAAAGLIGGLAERGHALQILDDAVANPDQRDRLRVDYGNAGDRMTVGFVVAGAGGAMLAVGIPLGIDRHRRAETPAASISGWWTSDDSSRAGGFRLSGRW